MHVTLRRLQCWVTLPCNPECLPFSGPSLSHPWQCFIGLEEMTDIGSQQQFMLWWDSCSMFWRERFDTRNRHCTQASDCSKYPSVRIPRTQALVYTLCSMSLPLCTCIPLNRHPWRSQTQLMSSVDICAACGHAATSCRTLWFLFITIYMYIYKFK